MTHVALALVCVAMTLLSAGASAQSTLSGAERDARARKLHEAGAVQFAQGQFESALDLFDQAYEMSGRVQLLYNVGLAADRAGLPERAEAAYSRYLAAQPNGARAAEVTARLSELERASSKRVPSPREVAARDDASPASPDSVDRRGEPLRKSWWLWTSVGVVVLGGVVAGVMATRGGDTTPLPETTTGLQVSALRGY